MNVVDILLARAQVGLAFLFSLGFFALLFALMIWKRDLGSTELTIMTSLLSVLGTLLTQQISFFFARTRPPALPDPSTTTTTTQTQTTPTPLTVPPGATLKTAPAAPVVIEGAPLLTPSSETKT